MALTLDRSALCRLPRFSGAGARPTRCKQPCRAIVYGGERNQEKDKKSKSGKLRIGDDWNAITIIALSQSDPLKAVAEFVENSIDARARNITITRGREQGEHYLRIMDDGEGMPKDGDGVPNFKYAAAHICDSIKRQLKIDGAKGIQRGATGATGGGV